MPLGIADVATVLFAKYIKYMIPVNQIGLTEIDLFYQQVMGQCFYMPCLIFWGIKIVI